MTGVISSTSFVCGGVVRHPLHRSQAHGGAHLSTLSEHESRAHQLVPASDHSARRSRSSASTQRHLTSATEHERALTTRELALRAVAMGRRRPTRPELPTTEAHARVPPQESPSNRAAGAWRVVVTTSRHVPHSAAPQAQRRTVRAVIDREAARRQARRHDARPHGPQSSARRWPLGSQNERPASS